MITNTARILRLAALLALISAFGQNFLRAIAEFFVDRPGNYGTHIWWATAAGDLALQVGVALLVILVARLIPRISRGTAMTTVVLFPPVMTALLLVPRINPWALAIVALGVSVRAAAILEKHRDTADRLVRRALPVAGVATAAIALMAFLTTWLSERRAEDRLPPAQADHPNVLLLIWDTVRAGSLSLYGHAAPTTPGLSALAERGVAFDRAYAAAPWTLPSHASFFTGRDAHELSTNWRSALDDSRPVLAEVLSAAGYRTAGFSANRLYVTRAFGLARGFIHFDDESRGLGAVVRASTLARRIVTSEFVRHLTGYADEPGRIRAADQQRRLLRWLDGRQGRPFFAFVNFMDAHAPYLPSAPFDTAFGMFDGATPSRERRRLRLLAYAKPSSLTPDDSHRVQRAYEGSIAALDAATAELLRALDERGYLRNTLVIVAADHGEEFGEHGTWVHGNSLYPQSLHVPLVISFPAAVPRAARVPAVVSLRDLPATILDLAGMKPLLPGTSLRQWWSGSGAASDARALAEVRYAPGLDPTAPVSGGTMAAVITDSLQLIREGNGRERLFDLVTEPFTGKEIPNRPELAARLRVSLPPRRN